jgi:hypothetical protein
MICRKSDSFVNATLMCKAGEKKFASWYRLDSTKDLIKELENELKADVQNGGNNKNAQGSWIHPDLAVQLAQWISPVFSLKVSKWIRELALTGSVSLKNEKTSQELLELQKDYKKLTINHTKILEKRNHHKFKTGAVFYLISDMESNCKKYKPGFEGIDINIRLAQHRSTCPSVKLEYLIYSGESDCKLMEKSILKRYESKRKYKNHEWIYEVNKKHILSSINTLLEFLGIKYTNEEDIKKYNEEII